jgi:hypothetical protein
MRNLLFQKLSASDYPSSSWPDQISSVSTSNRIDTKLKQLIFDISKTIIKHDPIKFDDIPLINEARTNWTEYLIKRLIAVSNKLITNFNEQHPKKEESDKPKPVPFIYDWKELKSACASICNLRGRGKEVETIRSHNLSKHTFESIDIFELKKTFSDIAPENENLIGNEEDDIELVEEREGLADILFNKGGSLDIENFSRRGVPNGIRI